MDSTWIPIFLPFALILGRVSAFMTAGPIFSWQTIPVRVRVSLTLLVTIFFAIITPADPGIMAVHWATALWLLIKEILFGAALGLAVRLVYQAAQQAGLIIGRQMGFSLASVIDPVSGGQSQPTAMLFEITFALLFLVGGGHHLLLQLIGGSFDAFPINQTPSIAALAGGLVSAGSAMLLFALKLSAPLIAAFMVLSVVMGIIAKVLPEMNVLMMSLPLRVALGFFMAAAIVPTLEEFAHDLARWMNTSLIT